MKRETKIGLVVAGTFLCAMGGLVALKFRQAEEPKEGDATEMAQSALAAPIEVAANPVAPANTNNVQDPSFPSFPQPQGLNSNDPPPPVAIPIAPPMAAPVETPKSESLLPPPPPEQVKEIA